MMHWRDVFFHLVSKYGDRATTTRTNDLRDCRVLGASNSDEERKERLENELHEVESLITPAQSKVCTH